MDQQPQPPQQPVTSEPEFNQPQRPRNTRLYFLIAIIALVGAAAYGGIWWWGKQSAEVAVPTVTPRVIDETSNWQTYRSEEYGFEFKYPAKFNIREEDFTHEGFTSPGRKSIGWAFIDKEKIDQVQNQIFYLSINSWQVIPLTVESEEFFNKNGVDYKKTTSFAEGVKQVVYSFDRGGDEFEFLLYVYNYNDGILADQILSTFKFTEPKEGTVCIQVITPARNTETGEVRDFPTPCDVPEGWIKI